MLKLDNKFDKFDSKKAYNLYRNVARFYFAEEKNLSNPDNTTYVFNLAKACEMTGDFLGAEKYLNYIKQFYPNWYPELIVLESKHLEIRRNHKFVDVKCDNERLRIILQNLVSVFFNINKNINVFITENEEDYKTIALTELGYLNKVEVPIYTDWIACGFYERPGIHCLVFKKEYISNDDDELTGLCAHELAHFELYDTLTVQNTLYRYEADDINLFREWTTDMQVIQRGFAYELFKERRMFSNTETRVFTAQEVEHFVQKIADYSQFI